MHANVLNFALAMSIASGVVWAVAVIKWLISCDLVRTATAAQKAHFKVLRDIERDVCRVASKCMMFAVGLYIGLLIVQRLGS